MTIYNFYLFNKYGKCIYYKDFQRVRKNDMDQEEEFKLIYDSIQQLKSYTTNSYKMFYMETLTEYRLIINTDPDASNIHDLLQSIYKSFAEIIVSNGLIDPNDKVNCEDFENTINHLITSHPSYQKVSLIKNK
ncbi:Trafficking protein particle complex subunit 1 [Strongyloides ratti]|uniref:Trafficking protein particle complex subunit n=1 Tax=Strongyloides ratti TaxID=34506 RepID=A0A090MUN8_STRRB|nr:Trafficking protein particle complex subunit 1 [Strongyloides ratti]CEF62333.1 Trafficking protein particle complex subunit 1 [Strongyloides ratti]